MRILSALLLIIVVLFYAQIPFSQPFDDPIFEQTFDDYEDAGWSIQGTYMIDDGIDDVGYSDTPGWMLFIAGGSTSPFDAQMFRNITYESASDSIYRIQYRVQAETVPFEITTSIRSTESPYLGMFYHFIIPEGYEQEWIFVDFMIGPAEFYQTDRLSLQFRMGAQPEQNLVLDDIRLYEVPALASSAGYNLTTDKELNFPYGFVPPDGEHPEYNNSFEIPVINANAEGATLERIQSKDASEGVHYLRASATSANDVSITINSQNDPEYTGNYRIHCLLRSNQESLNITAGLSDSALLDGERRIAPEMIVLTTPDEWIDASFLVPSGSFAGDHIYPFFQFNGDSNTNLDIDRVFVFKTDEEVTSLPDWPLY